MHYTPPCKQRVCHSTCEGQRDFTMPHPRGSACASHIAASSTLVRWRVCTLLERCWHCAHSNAVPGLRCGVVPASYRDMRCRNGERHSTAAGMHVSRVLHATDSRCAVCVRERLSATELSRELLASAAVAHVKSPLRHRRARMSRRNGEAHWPFLPLRLASRWRALLILDSPGNEGGAADNCLCCCGGGEQESGEQWGAASCIPESEATGTALAPKSSVSARVFVALFGQTQQPPRLVLPRFAALFCLCHFNRRTRLAAELPGAVLMLCFRSNCVFPILRSPSCFSHSCASVFLCPFVGCILLLLPNCFSGIASRAFGLVRHGATSSLTPRRPPPHLPPFSSELARGMEGTGKRKKGTVSG